VESNIYLASELVSPCHRFYKTDITQKQTNEYLFMTASCYIIISEKQTNEYLFMTASCNITEIEVLRCASVHDGTSWNASSTWWNAPVVNDQRNGNWPQTDWQLHIQYEIERQLTKQQIMPKYWIGSKNYLLISDIWVTKTKKILISIIKTKVIMQICLKAQIFEVSL